MKGPWPPPLDSFVLPIPTQITARLEKFTAFEQGNAPLRI